MSFRIITYTRDGVPLSEHRGDAVFSRERNRAGKALIKVALSETTLTRSNMNFRNLISIEDSNAGLWGGVLWTPRTWYRDYVELTAYSGEYLLKFRRSGKNVLKASTGTIYSQMIDISNQPEQLALVKDSIWDGSNEVQLTLKYDNMYDAVTKFADRVGNDFSFEPAIDEKGNLKFFARWYQQQGVNRGFGIEYPFDFKLPEGQILQEQGDIANDVIVFGGGASANSTPISDVTVDQTSKSQYGLIHGVFANNSVVNATLDAQAVAQLALVKQPRNTFMIALVHNTVKDTFHNIGIGDTMVLRLSGIGFAANGGLGTEATVRVYAKEYNTETGVMAVVVDQVNI